MSGRVRGQRRRLVERQGAVGELRKRVWWRAAFARGESSYALEPNPSTSAAPRPQAERAVDRTRSSAKKLRVSGRRRLARGLTKTDVCRRPGLTRTYHGCPVFPIRFSLGPSSIRLLGSPPASLPTNQEPEVRGKAISLTAICVRRLFASGTPSQMNRLFASFIDLSSD